MHRVDDYLHPFDRYLVANFYSTTPEDSIEMDTHITPNPATRTTHLKTEEANTFQKRSDKSISSRAPEVEKCHICGLNGIQAYRYGSMTITAFLCSSHSKR